MDRAALPPAPLGARSLRQVPALAALLLLAGLDLVRAYAGPGVRGWQWAAGALALALLARGWSRGGAERRDWLPRLALAACLLPTAVDHARVLQSDGIHYYAYLRSLLFDGDLDFANDFALLGRSPVLNVLPIGAAILWTPFVLVVHLGREAARLFGASAPTGVEPLYQAAVCLASLAYGAAGLFLLMRTLERYVPPAAAFWAVVLCWVGSPLRFYLSVLPGMAHAGEFFVAVLALRAYFALRARADVRRAALAGAACGLAFLIRSQDGLLLALPALELASRWRRGADPRALIRIGLALLVAFALVALPQMAVWQAMFGTPVLVPHRQMHGDQFTLPQPELFGTLFSPRGGAFVNYPALFLAFLGTLWLARRDPRYVLAALPVVCGMWLVNAYVFDWFQVRRFTGVVPLLAPGLAIVVAALARGGLVLMAILALLTLRFDLALDRLRQAPGDPAPLRAVAREMSDATAAEVYQLLERVAPRAAVAGLAVYTGQELLEGPVSWIDLGEGAWVVRLPRPAQALSTLEAEEGTACRWVRDRQARLFLPLPRSLALRLGFRARALETEEPQSVEAVWNGASLGQAPMRAAWAEYAFDVPREHVRVGTNTLELRFARAPIYRRARGTGPREVRPAALADLSLHRPPQ